MKNKNSTVVIRVAAGKRPAVLTLTAKGRGATLTIHQDGQPTLPDASLALNKGHVYPLFQQAQLAEFVERVEEHEVVSDLLDTPLAMGHLPRTVADTVRACMVDVVARDTRCSTTAQREVLYLGTFLACLCAIWEDESPGRGDAYVQTLLRGALGDLDDQSPGYSQALKNLVGWGNEDEQWEEEVQGLREQVREFLQETLHALRSMRDNPFGGDSALLTSTRTRTPDAASSETSRGA